MNVRRVLDAGREGFVHEDRQTGLDERPGAAHVVEAVVGGDDHGIHLADDILGLGHNVWNQGGGGDERGLGGIVGPEMGDARAGNAHGVRRVGAHVGRDAGIGAAREGGGIVAVDDGDQENGCPLPGIIPSMARRRGEDMKERSSFPPAGRAKTLAGRRSWRRGRQVETQRLRGGLEGAESGGLPRDLIEEGVRLADKMRVALRDRALVPRPVRGAGGERAPSLPVKLDLHAAAHAIELQRDLIGVLKLVQRVVDEHTAMPGADVHGVFDFTPTSPR
jgi:hypothetical protein